MEKIFGAARGTFSRQVSLMVPVTAVFLVPRISWPPWPQLIRARRLVCPIGEGALVGDFTPAS